MSSSTLSILPRRTADKKSAGIAWWGSGLQKPSPIGLGIAKDVFQVHGVDAAGQVMPHRAIYDKSESQEQIARSIPASESDPAAVPDDMGDREADGSVGGGS
jgi:hypothetical protein